MPLIVPEVSQEPINPPRIQATATPETFGGGAGLEQEGAQLQKIAASGGEIASLEKIRADTAATEEAIGQKVSPYVTDKLYNPDSGAIARINKASSHDEVLSIQKETLDDLNKKFIEVGSNLSGDGQVAVYNKHAFGEMESINRILMGHIDQRMSQIYDKSFGSFVDNKIAQSAMGWGNLGTRTSEGITQQDKNLKDLQLSIDQYAVMKGMSSDPKNNYEKRNLESKVFSNYHASIIDRMLADGQQKTAVSYFNNHKDAIDQLDVRENVERNLTVIPKQQEEAAKRQKEEMYTSNERQGLMNIADGKMSLSEVDRMFKNDQIDKSTYELFERKMSDPKYMDMRSFDTSDPITFNAIREAQLHGSSPKEITRMITEAQAEKMQIDDKTSKFKLNNDDVKYLTKLTKDIPPTARDRELDATANSIRDFGNRYYDSSSSTFGNIFGAEDKAKEIKSKDTEGLVQQFYQQADKEKASGERLNEIKEEIQHRAIAQKYPGLKGKDLPDIIVNVNGQITRVLDPDSKSKAKAKYKITPTMSQDVEAQ